MNKYFVTCSFICVSFLLLSSCTKETSAGTQPTSSSVATNAPSAKDLNGLSAREALKVANGWKGISGVTTYVDQQEINFAFTSGEIVSVPLPKEEMIVAIAPYIQNTHPCEIHYMSGCQGELVDLPFEVKATDGEGNIVVDDTYTSLANGFIELWLPRDVSLEVTISGAGKTASSVIETYAASNTCITTIKLTG